MKFIHQKILIFPDVTLKTVSETICQQRRRSAAGAVNTRYHSDRRGSSTAVTTRMPLHITLTDHKQAGLSSYFGLQAKTEVVEGETVG